VPFNFITSCLQRVREKEQKSKKRKTKERLGKQAEERLLIDKKSSAGHF
jgi:hypothetical protein